MRQPRLAVVDSSFLPHPELPSLSPLSGPNPANHDHGTRTLGLVLGHSTGLAPQGVLAALACPAPGKSIIASLHQAMRSCLQAEPDVLLVNLCFNHRWPVVYAESIRALARQAWDRGCLCVFPAGNAGLDLDLESDVETERLALLGEESWLVVGAVNPESGERVGNVGRCIHTLGHTQQHSTSVEMEGKIFVPGHVPHFGGTSAAAAQLSGMAMALAAGMQTWTPAQLKAQLTCLENLESDGVPRLSRVLERARLAPDTERE
ncbi:MAG: hypothetical protein ACI9VR_002752 [Cognaticolwellia sp.]|jgi:hypothetical protein